MNREKASRVHVAENLKDAGCQAPFIEQFMVLWDAGTVREQLRLLNGYRGELLDEIHAGQKKLDRLDYLRYQLQGQIKDK